MTTNWIRILPAALLAFGLTAKSARAAAPATPQGIVTGKLFSNLTGTTVGNLTNSAKFPNTPDALFFFPYFEWNATGDIATPSGNFSDNYDGSQIVGYFYPPTTGDYIFWMASDDNGSLYLSPDADPAKKRLIALETVWSNAREYTISGGVSDLTAKDSSQFTATEWPTKNASGGAQITLQAGQAYYIEAIAKEGTGGDFLSVAVRDPGGTIDPSSPIPGQYLSSDRAAGAVSIANQPQSRTVGERGSATFQVLPDGTPPYTYQWRKNGTDILDATNINYTVSSASIGDNNAKYSVVVTGAQGTATSQDAVLTVTADTVLPTVLTAKGSPSLTEVVVTFSEPLDPVSGAAVANYQISSAAGALNVTAAALSSGGTQVSLTTAPQTLGTKYTLLVSNVKDTAATPNTITANTKSVFFPTGKLSEINGMIVIEAENYDRNLDGLWVRDTIRGIPSAGASVVNPNGAGGSETATKLEYDVEFKQAGTYTVWIRASGDNGNDDSVWFHLDGDGDGATERPAERIDANQASMSGFQPQADFVWRSDSQDGPDPFTVEIPAAGPRAIALARREDGSFIDKIILTTDAAFSPAGFGPPETREGAPGLPTVSISSPATGQSFSAGANIPLAVTAAGQSGLEIARVQYTANGSVIGETAVSPFGFTWTNVASGIYGLQAIAFDEIGQSTVSAAVNVTVTTPSGATIGWVSFHPADNTPSAAAATAGFTNAPDIAYTDLLKANGHTVTRIVTSDNPNTNLLNAFDLVIISRSVISGNYELANETAAWNGITAPTIIMSGYILRANRLGFSTGNTIPDTAGPVKLTVNNPAHAIFAGITLDAANTMVNDYTTGLTTFNTRTNRGISVNTDPVPEGGTVLATIGSPAEDPAIGGTVLAEWKAGATLANATANVLGGDRLIFLSGSREYDGLTSEGSGIFDLTPDGVKLFLNAVNYMAGATPTPPAPTISFTRTATGLSISFTGTLQSSSAVAGGWADEAGATSPFAVTANQPMKFYRAKR